jgi:hypothetical protein
MQKPPDLSYPVDNATWNKAINPLKKENQKEEILNGYLTHAIQFWINHRFRDRAL